MRLWLNRKQTLTHKRTGSIDVEEDTDTAAVGEIQKLNHRGVSMQWVKVMLLSVLVAHAGGYAISIGGRVVNALQQPVVNATVILKSNGQRTTSGADGTFVLSTSEAAVAPGKTMKHGSISIRLQGNSLLLNASAGDIPVSIMMYSVSGRVAFSHTIVRAGRSVTGFKDQMGHETYVIRIKSATNDYQGIIQNTGDLSLWHFSSSGNLNQSDTLALSKRQTALAFNDTLIISCPLYATRKVPIDNSLSEAGSIVLQSIAIDTAILTNSDTLANRGMAYFSRGIYDSAAASLAEYISRYPAGSMIEDARYYYGRTFFESGNYGHAREELARFLSDYPTTQRKDWAEYYLGQSWYSSNEYDSSRVWFTDVLTKYPDSSSADDALYFLARSEYELKNYAAAKAHFQGLISGYPLSSYQDGSAYNLGLTCYELAQYDTAITIFHGFPAAYPQSQYLDNAQYFEAKCYYRKRAYSTAISLFTEFLSAHANAINAPNARLLIGDCWFEQGTLDTTNYRKALQQYQTCLTTWPSAATAPSATEGIGESYFFLNDMANARTWLGRVETNYPQSIHVSSSRYYLGRCDMEDNLYDAAITIFHSFQIAYPKSQYLDNAQYYEAKCYYRKKAYSTAISLFTEFLSAHANATNAPNARLLMGDCWFEQGSLDTTNYRKALQQYQICLTTWPTAATAPSATEGIGESYFFLNDTANARTWFGLVETNYPQSIQMPSSLYYLARCDMVGTLYDAAIAKFDRVLTSYPNSIKADNSLYQQARCHFYLSHYTNALSLFVSYRATYPQGAYGDNSYYYTVRIYVAQSDCPMAKIELSRMQTLYPASPNLASTQTYCQSNCP